MGLAGHHLTVLSPTCLAGVKNNSKCVLAKSTCLCALPPEHGFPRREASPGRSARLRKSLPCTHFRSHIWRHPGCPLKPGSAPPPLLDSHLQGPPPCMFQGVCTSILTQSPGLAVISWPVSTPHGPLSAPPAVGTCPRCERSPLSATDCCVWTRCRSGFWKPPLSHCGYRKQDRDEGKAELRCSHRTQPTPSQAT